MRVLGTLVLAFLLSAVVAAGVQVQLGFYFQALLEIAIAMMALAAMTVLTTAALGFALAFWGNTAAIDRTVLALVALTVAGLGVLIASTSIPVREDIPILTEIAVPILVMIAIQWWLVRRNVLTRGAAIEPDRG